MILSSLISVIVGLAVIGVGIYLIDLIPMDKTIKQIIRVVVILLVVLWVLSALGFTTLIK